MSEFFLSGVVFTLLYLLPVVVLHLLCNLFYILKTRKQAKVSLLARINFDIYRYLAYMLAAPAMMLIVSVFMGYRHDFDIVKNSMIWLIVAITIAFTWIIYRLVRVVAEKGRLEAKPEQG